MKDIFERITELIKSDSTFCIVTVVDTTGTTPRKAGARAIVLSGGIIEGTVGGGSIEMEAIETAQQVLKAGKTLFKEYVLQDLKEGMTCGGTMNIFYEPVYPQRRVSIFGGGHVGREIAHVAHHAGWHTRVIDHRHGVLAPQFFPEQVELIATPYIDYINDNTFGVNDWIVIVTPKHEFDQQVLEHIVQHDVAYIGMMGSLQKVNEVMQNLQKSGITEELLSKVYAPIGLNIGKETPGEIAVSIVGEMLAVLYGVEKIVSMKRV